MIFNIGWSGHVNITLPLVRGLVAGGWTVVYYCFGPYRDKVEKAGAEYREYCPGFNYTHHNLGAALPLSLQPAAVALLPSLLTQLRALQPAFILYDGSRSGAGTWGRSWGSKPFAPCQSLSSRKACSRPS